MTTAPPLRYVFGPIPSRRLGQSLGVDPIPLKACNWNCGYCQLGRTSDLDVAPGRPIPAEEILADLRTALAEANGSIDWITFVGSGEPTLHRDLGLMIREAKRLSSKPVAVITNGSLLGDPAVQASLAEADAVMPTISAGSEDVYLRLHRPAKHLGYADFVGGLIAFRSGYRGKLWAEVMLVDGLNDQPDEVAALGELLRRARPDEIQVVRPTRPPTEVTVRGASDAALERAQVAFSTIAKVYCPDLAPAPKGAADHVRAPGTDADLGVPKDQTLEATVLGMIARHPMTAAEIGQQLPVASAEDLDRVLELIKGNGLAQLQAFNGNEYYAPGAGRYGKTKKRPTG